MHLNFWKVPAHKGPKKGQRMLFYTRDGKIAVDHFKLSSARALRIPDSVANILVKIGVAKAPKT